MNLTPEQKARLDIDAALEAAGWILQNRDAINLAAGPGVAVREAKMASGHGFADYLLFVCMSTGVETRFINGPGPLPHGHQRLLPPRLLTAREAFLGALRADAWLHAVPDSPPPTGKRSAARSAEAFLIDSPAWRAGGWWAEP